MLIARSRIAPYMRENAFIAFTVCGALGYKWQTALAAVFIAGALFIVMTVLHVRQWIVNAVPVSLRYSFAVGIGLFLTFIGLNQAGSYSSRSAMIGSTRTALIAGARAARNAMASSTAVARENTSRSVGATPTSRLRR